MDIDAVLISFSYVALLIAFLAFVISDNRASAFVFMYLMVWEGMEHLLAYFSLPDFPFLRHVWGFC